MLRTVPALLQPVTAETAARATSPQTGAGRQDSSSPTNKDTGGAAGKGPRSHQYNTFDKNWGGAWRRQCAGRNQILPRIHQHQHTHQNTVLAEMLDTREPTAAFLQAYSWTAPLHSLPSPFCPTPKAEEPLCVCTTRAPAAPTATSATSAKPCAHG